MKRPASILSAILVVFPAFAAPSLAEAPPIGVAAEELRFAFQAGATVVAREKVSQELEFEVQGTPVSIQIDQEFAATWTVGAVDQGTAKIRRKVDAVKMTARTPFQDEEYDSTDPGSKPGDMTRPVAALVGWEVSFSVPARGTIGEIGGLDQVRKVLEESGVGPAERETIAKDAGTGFRFVYLELPAEPVAIGGTWKQEFRAPISADLDMIFSLDIEYLGAQNLAGHDCRRYGFRVTGARLDLPPGASTPLELALTNGEGTAAIDASTGLPVTYQLELGLTIRQGGAGGSTVNLRQLRESEPVPAAPGQDGR